MLLTIVVVSFVTGFVFAFWHLTRQPSTGILPPGAVRLPGPKGLPIIGSVFELSLKNPWMTFQNWRNRYGPIYQCNLAGSNHIWISDEGIAQDLLAKRGAIYSDRPHIPGLIADNRTSGRYLPLMTKNETWQRQRRFGKTIMATCRTALFYGYPELESKRLLMELLDDPSNYDHCFESYIARVTCRLAWATPEASDELKQRARELLIGVSPTGSLANKFPFIMSLPAMLSPPKAWELRREKTEQVFFETMQKEVKIDVAQHKARPSWMKTFFDYKSHWGFHGETEAAYAVGMHGIAGALTVAAPMQGFCLAMCHYPQYLPKLQQEIDKVCGDRPPVFQDMPNLPYLRACIRETMRWRPPVPTGIPHEVSQGDVYNGYHIPARSIVHPFEWGMTRNPQRYPLPNAFNPERWLDPAYPTYEEPLSKYPQICNSSQFGFGRRVCQGMEVTEADLLCGIGALAWAFTLGKARDADTGLEVPVPEMDYGHLLIAKPKWFRFDMKPRTDGRRAKIMEMFHDEDAKGSFPPARTYWDERNPALGWAKV